MSILYGTFPVSRLEPVIRTSFQGIIFVVLRSCHSNRYVQALLRQLVHPDVIVDGYRSCHCATAISRLRSRRRLAAKLPARVDERLHRAFRPEDEHVPEFRDSEA